MGAEEWGTAAVVSKNVITFYSGRNQENADLVQITGYILLLTVF